MNKARFAGLLEEYRLRTDLSQGQLARLLGVHSSLISRWKSTAYSLEPSTSQLGEICKVLRLDAVESAELRACFLDLQGRPHRRSLPAVVVAAVIAAAALSAIWLLAVRPSFSTALEHSGDPVAHTASTQVSMNPAEHFARGFAAAHFDKDYATARNEFDRALEGRPNWAEAHYERGFAKEFSGQLQEAVADYLKSIELFPINSEVYFRLGATYLKNRQSSLALGPFEEAIRLTPLYGAPYWGRGVVFSQIGNISQAMTDFNRAIELAPDTTSSYLYFAARGRLLARMGDKPRAIADYETALALPIGESAMRAMLEGELRQIRGD
jgi:tetratricopeptide (TPR) repeat protein